MTCFVGGRPPGLPLYHVAHEDVHHAQNGILNKLTSFIHEKRRGYPRLFIILLTELWTYSESRSIVKQIINHISNI